MKRGAEKERERILIPNAYKFSLFVSGDLNDIRLLQESKDKPL